jgi:hypothetical protein
MDVPLGSKEQAASVAPAGALFLQVSHSCLVALYSTTGTPFRHQWQSQLPDGLEVGVTDGVKDLVGVLLGGKGVDVGVTDCVGVTDIVGVGVGVGVLDEPGAGVLVGVIDMLGVTDVVGVGVGVGVLVTGPGVRVGVRVTVGVTVGVRVTVGVGDGLLVTIGGAPWLGLGLTLGVGDMLSVGVGVRVGVWV